MIFPISKLITEKSLPAAHSPWLVVHKYPDSQLPEQIPPPATLPDTKFHAQARPVQEPQLSMALQLALHTGGTLAQFPIVAQVSEQKGLLFPLLFQKQPFVPVAQRPQSVMSWQAAGQSPGSWTEPELNWLEQ